MSVSDKPNQKCAVSDWMTPTHIVNAVTQCFGGCIDIDPATTSSNPTKAATFYTKETDGLKQLWKMNTFVNPPYGKELQRWIPKIAQEAARGIGILALLPASRTETKFFQENFFGVALSNLKTITYLRGRLKFIHPTTMQPMDSNTWASVIYGFNVDAIRVAESFAELGTTLSIS